MSRKTKKSKMDFTILLFLDTIVTNNWGEFKF